MHKLQKYHHYLEILTSLLTSCNHETYRCDDDTDRQTLHNFIIDAVSPIFCDLMNTILFTGFFTFGVRCGWWVMAHFLKIRNRSRTTHRCEIIYEQVLSLLVSNPYLNI